MGGFGVGPIPWNHLQEYIILEGLDEESAILLELVIAILDRHYLKTLKDKMDKDAKKAKRKARISGR